MRKITYFCDRCGKQITSDLIHLGVRFIDPANGELVDEEWGAELCRECSEIVDDATVKAIKMTQKPAPKKKPVNRPAPNKVDIDMGKVFALREAGWSLDKIGEEFRVSGQTIANHITAYNKKKEVE